LKSKPEIDSACVRGNDLVELVLGREFERPLFAHDVSSPAAANLSVCAGNFRLIMV
jgi:hypothetical protein